MVDYYSNFIKVAELKRDTVIREIKENIARYGIMDTLVSDNDSQWNQQSKDFTRANEIQHPTSSPLQPQSNCLAEKAVQILKSILKKCADSEYDVHLALLDLRNTPRDAEMFSPMQRLISRRAKTLIPSYQWQFAQAVRYKTKFSAHSFNGIQTKTEIYYDQHAKSRPSCDPGNTIRIQAAEGWKPAEYVSSSTHPLSHTVRADSQGRTYRRNNYKLMKTREDLNSIQMKRKVYILSHSTQMKQETAVTQVTKLSVMNKPSTDLHLPKMPK